jgi:hypothetical protein
MGWCISLHAFVEKLINNYAQAMNCMIRMEGKLGKTRRMEEFNKQFQDNIDREVLDAPLKRS